MSKKQKDKNAPQHMEFTLREVRRHAARGLHSVLSAIEKAIESGLTVLEEVWQWVATNFIKNVRALELLQEHAPALVTASKTA